MEKLENFTAKTSEYLQKIIDDAKNTIESVKNSETIEFVTPLNPLDPIVVFDPELEFSNIVLNYSDFSEDGSTTVEGLYDDENNLKIQGIRKPIVKLNNKVLTSHNISFMKISITKFLPQIEIEVIDTNGNIQATDVPGMNNIITVILIAPVNGANKKMSMDFYIEDCKFNDDGTVLYKGKYKLNDLRKRRYEQIGDKSLTTYETLSEIAKNCKLGFAASEQCKEIQDKKWRQLYSKNYIEYIETELQNSGLNEESIFDTWIDNFGYLVMVNLSHIFSAKIDAKQLVTKVIKGMTNDLPNDESPDQEVEQVLRLITNSRAVNSIHNLFIDNYKSVVNNSDILNKGTSNKYYYLTSVCDNNLIQEHNIDVIENSIDGLNGIDDYKYENIEYIGSCQEDEEENSDKVPSIVQKQNIQNFKNKLNAKKLLVELPTANYSLERGTLIQVIIEEYESQNKRTILENLSNSIKTEKDGDNYEKKSSYNENEQNIIIDQNNSVPNPSLCGIYYIDGIEYNYFDGTDTVKQTLILIKKGIQNNINNKYTNPKL